MTSPESPAPVIAHLGLGSNLGDRAENIAEAIRRIDAMAHTTVVATSPLYESEAWYVTEQPQFINACITVETTAHPRELLDALLAVEEAMGRVRNVPKGPRTIDLDILFWGDDVIDAEGLTVPHPGVLERPFVLVPLVDLAPDLVHPRTGRTLADHLETATLPDAGLRRLNR